MEPRADPPRPRAMTLEERQAKADTNWQALWAWHRKIQSESEE